MNKTTQALRDACRSGPDCKCTLNDAADLIESQQAHIAELERQLALWKDAIDDELVSCGIRRAAHDKDPRRGIRDAIAWNVAVALDPAVSAEARKLVELARAEEKEVCAQEAESAASDASKYDIADAIRARSKP